MSQGYGDAPFSVLDPILAKHGLIPLGKMLEYQGYVRHGNSWSPDAIPGVGERGAVRRNSEGIDNYRKSLGGFGLSPLGPYQGPRITVPLSPQHRSDLGSPSQPQSGSATPPAPVIPNLTISVPVNIDGRQITEVIVKDAAQYLRRSTGQKSSAWG